MTYQSTPFDIRFDEVTERSCPNLYFLDPSATAVAGPFFDVGGSTICLSRRLEHRSDRSLQMEHHHFSLMVQGRMICDFGKKAFTAEPGDLVCIPAGTLIERTAPEPVERFYFDIKDLPQWAPLKKAGPTIRPYESARHMHVLGTEIIDAWLNPDVYSNRCACESATMLAKLLERELYQLSRERTLNREVRLVELIAEIRSNPGADCSRAAMADAVGVSERHLTQIFTEAFGVPPWKMIIKIRMHHAMMMLSESTVPLEAIGEAVGYGSTVSFYRAFKDQVGMSPGAFRKQHSRSSDL